MKHRLRLFKREFGRTKPAMHSVLQPILLQGLFEGLYLEIVEVTCAAKFKRHDMVDRHIRSLAPWNASARERGATQRLPRRAVEVMRVGIAWRAYGGSVIPGLRARCGRDKAKGEQYPDQPSLLACADRTRHRYEAGRSAGSTMVERRS